jgi:hypothetical protein
MYVCGDDDVLDVVLFTRELLKKVRLDVVRNEFFSYMCSLSPIFATWAMDINTPHDWWLFMSHCKKQDLAFF